MNWSEHVLQFVDDHKPDVSGALGTLISRQVLAGCSISYAKGDDMPVEANIGLPSYLPVDDIDDENVLSLFITLAHGWPSHPFEPEPQPHLAWVRETSVWLYWPNRKLGWHWLLPMPESSPIPQQLNMAEYVYDRLPGGLSAHISVERDDQPLDVTLERHDGETLVTVVAADMTVSMRSREGMRACVMTAVEQLELSDEQTLSFN